MEKLKDFIMKHQPRVVAVAAECRDATSVMEDITRAVQEIEQEHQMSHVYVELVDSEIARIFQDSPRAEVIFKICLHASLQNIQIYCRIDIHVIQHKTFNNF